MTLVELHIDWVPKIYDVSFMKNLKILHIGRNNVDQKGEEKNTVVDCILFQPAPTVCSQLTQRVRKKYSRRLYSFSTCSFGDKVLPAATQTRQRATAPCSR